MSGHEETCPTACMEYNHRGREHDEWLGSIKILGAIRGYQEAQEDLAARDARDETLADLIAVDLALYVLPANYSHPYGAANGDSHDRVAERGGDLISRRILASDWLAARDARVAATARADALAKANDLIADLIADHQMWIGDDGEGLDYLPEREALINDFCRQFADALRAATEDPS